MIRLKQHKLWLKFFLPFLFLFVTDPAMAASQLTFEPVSYLFTAEEEPHYFLKTQLKSRTVFSKNWISQIGLNLSYSNLENSSDKPYFINPTGTRLIYRNSSLVFALGFNAHDYKIAQVFGPMDFVDQNNFWDPLNPERLADFSLRTSFKTGAVRWRLTYIPYRMKPVYPGQESFWLPRQLPDSIPTDDRNVLFPDDPTYKWEDTQVFRNSHKHNFSIMGEYKNKTWLWRWSYYNGLDTDPNFHLELNLQNIDFENLETIYPIIVIPVQNKIQRVGFGFRYVTPIKWRLFFENSLSSGNAQDLVGEDYLYSSTFGLEWGLPFAGDILYGVLQGFYTVSSEPDNHLGVLPPLRRAALAALLWKKPFYELSLAHIYSFAIDVALTQFTTQVNFNKNFYAKGSVNLFGGSVPELISGIKNNDIVYLSLGYKTTF